jgi:hypothetical protein
MRILGVDPGTENFAVVVLENNQVVYARMLQNTIKSIAKKHEKQRELYRSSIRKLLVHTKPDAVIIESFSVRGFGTQLTEVVNLMIGSLQMLCDHNQVAENMVMASTWKGKLKQLGDLDALYAHAKLLGLEKHVCDALCLSTYMQNKLSFKPSDIKGIMKNLAVCKLWLQKNSPSHVKEPKRKTHEVSAVKRRGRSSVRKQGVLVKPQKRSRPLHGSRRRNR